MEAPVMRGRHEFNLASRKAEEAALRRYQATHWLDCIVGPLGISSQPTGNEFISCLRNGIVLCNLMNKIQPGSVPKVVASHVPSQSLYWDSQPLPAYQYFENIKNFLVAVDELKLPAFEASVLERENIEEASSAKVVDCILALKAYYEWKEMTGGKGSYQAPRSPFFHDPARRINLQSSGGQTHSDSRRKLDMSFSCNSQDSAGSHSQTLEDLITKTCVERMADAKENIDYNFLASFRQGNMDPVDLLSDIISKCVEEKLQNKLPKTISDPVSLPKDEESSPCSIPTPLGDIGSLQVDKCCKACLNKKSCHHWDLVKIQERELSKLKALLSSTKKEFGNLQSHMQSGFQILAKQVHEMSSAASGYHKAVNENRTLYNMVQDLKGNIRVYCRIRPTIYSEAKTVIDLVGNDGSLVVVDPLKHPKDGRKVFQFNRVFGPSATQDEVFQDTRPLIRSVMDGFNVCIFAYGQTGSGKTYTMSGPSGGSSRDAGINCLALNDLFQLSSERKGIIMYDIQVQMVEIYNEQVRDLLAKDSSVTRLEIRNCPGYGGLMLPDATLHSVKGTADVINLMELGDKNRAVCPTAINTRSSRSHSVLTVHVAGEDIVTGSKLRSCLHLVDLAGSERIDKSEVTGDALKEAQFINKSLSSLGDVIAALAQKNSHIPYRNSKLTQLLQNSLGRQAKTLMFAHVSPEVDSFGETMSTLKFAQRASTVELGAARSNKESCEILQLKAEIESLKQALASEQSLTPRTITTKEGVKETPQRTPLRPRRLSIENCNTMKSERTNSDMKKEVKTPSVQNRSRRLSLEGTRGTNISNSINPEVTHRDTIGIRKPSDISSQRPLRSPTSSALRKKITNENDRIKISLELPQTPEPTGVVKNEVLASSDILTPGFINGTPAKASQIRKSLRTIGKLINGSEKRNQPKTTEPKSPFAGSSRTKDIKSPRIPASVRASRRQSLTGGLPPERSRRTSVGGANENRNARTPPPAHSLAEVTNLWF